jgi:hypothetical protein
VLVSLLLGAALAAPPAFYDPDQVAGASALFKAATDEVGPRYLAIEGQLRRLSPAVEELELATALAQDRIGKDGRAWAIGTRTAAVEARLAAQAQVDQVQDGYVQAFEAALARALPGLSAGREVRECFGGTGMAALMARRTPCAGDDLSPALAASMDADPALQAEIARIAALPWPELTLPSQAQPVVALTGSEGFIELAPLARAIAGERLELRADAFDRAVAPLMDQIDAGDAEALAQARGARESWERGLAAEGQVLLPLLEEALGRLKKGAGASVGLCPNPSALGGCEGQDRTAELLPLLAADKKLAKAIAALP